MNPVTPIPDMKLELVPVPVADIDRAKRFYAEQLGFVVDLDVQPNDAIRIVQLTPPGSACSISLSKGLREISDMTPGTVKVLHLVVGDIRQSRAALLERGVDVSEVEEHAQGVKYVYFSDPDGNSWVLQEMPWRSGEFEAVQM